MIELYSCREHGVLEHFGPWALLVCYTLVIVRVRIGGGPAGLTGAMDSVAEGLEAVATRLVDDAAPLKIDCLSL